MIYLVELSLLLSLIPFSFSLLVDVCFGRPAKEDFDIKAIFFFYPLRLAKRRLIKAGQYADLYSSFSTNLNSQDVLIRKTANDQYKKVVFGMGREYFTWELGFGMCPVCTNVRFSILFSLIMVAAFGFNLATILFITCFSNLYILIYNKLKF